MNAPAGRPDDQGFCLPALATVLVDGTGTVVGCSREAARLLGRPPGEVTGRPVSELLADGARWGPDDGAPVPRPGHGRAALRHADGTGVDVAFRVAATEGTAGAQVITFVPAETAVEWGRGVALLRALLGQHQIGVFLRRPDLTLGRSNITSGMFGVPDMRPGDRVADVGWVRDVAEVEATLRNVLTTGVPKISRQHRWRSGETPPRDRTVSVSSFRMEDARGEPSGVVVIVEDVTEQERIRQQRELLHSAATRIGFSLDVRRTAQALADVVNEIADMASVDITRPVLAGDELASPFPGEDAPLVRAAIATHGPWPEAMLGVGETFPALPDTPQVRDIFRDRPVLLSRQEIIGNLLGDEELVRLLVPEDAQQVLVSPLFARGLMLGAVTAWRTADSPAFGDKESRLLGEIASRAALGIDNARRYAYEHRAAVGLQERLLPRAVTDVTAAHTVGAYAPAGGGTGVGGDWFDVIELPSLRVAFVVGDVVGHGLPAAAGMGRLRTSVQNFAILELDPAEVLGHMEDLVQRLAAETPTNRSDTSGATCLYAVYDPTTRQCTFASAGQPAPLFVRPDGTTEQLDVPPGPPLGVGGMPYESTTLTLEPGGILALFTDGLLELDPYANGDGQRSVERRLAELYREGRSLEAMGDDLLAGAVRSEPRDDIAVLLARVNAVDPGSVAVWEFPAEAGSVAEARTAVIGQLEAWDLTHLVFTTELVVSELVTNAVRYAWAPIRVRLLRDQVLICEVSDPSNTQPRLIRAEATDEGGRGLFIVAQCTTRWGARYTSQGKTIWTEQPLDAAESPLISLPEL
ncbi:SpoIIE family protein phosphatase [Streptomyces sp. TS71-3]|uniref:ATP-binding SpoIIE family protein phosphatase n=1 Tax=Streptomyces sp. TS71-3 TaxID=2733862 RepID=UPI001B16C441|nr:SpoIIE family protein phosphatase [Streptomyces sp. TS71-3]GHJ35544.1 hypothetical protein Sm713_11530 [Streptomyces sp. TS71-3]